MIKDIEVLRRALKRSEYTGVILYEGPSKIDGKPIVAIAFRIGSYGDPATVPATVWKTATRKVKNRTGYTHQWDKKIGAGLKNLCMASADNSADVASATLKGWRTFRVRKHEAPTLANEAICPASKEGGQRVQCDSCGLCQGATIAARNIVIADHGLMDSRRRTSTTPVAVI